MRRPPRVIVVGAGFAGGRLARELAALDPAGERLDTVLVAPEPAVELTPLLFEVAAGVVAPEHARVPAIPAGAPARFVRGRVVAIDRERRTLLVQSPDGPRYRLAWDMLVLAAGGEARAGPGLPFKSLADALALRERLADARRIQVVGGGPTGVELAAELAALPDRAVVLVERHERLLAAWRPGLGAMVLAALREKGVDVRLGATPGAAELTVLAMGSRPTPLAATLGLPLDPAGRLRVDATLRCPAAPDLWALGDCAAGEPPCPPLAQHAVRQAATLARNLLAAIAGTRLTPYVPPPPAIALSLGPRDGLIDLDGWWIRGEAAWWARRAYYGLTLAEGPLRAQLLGDWLSASRPAT